MKHLALIGTSWRAAGDERLSACTVPLEARAELLPRLAEALESPEFVYLATCNRVEVAFLANAHATLTRERRVVWETLTGVPPEAGEAERELRAWAGEGALEHWFLVAAGLDSARVGETEIAGQLRRALDEADDLGLLGAHLALAGREALKLARRIHRHTGVGSGATSLASVAAGHMRRRLAATPGAVALVGVSPMTERLAETLASAGTPFVVANRTLARAAALCTELGAGTPYQLDAFVAQPAPVECVVSATAAAHPVLPRATLERLAGRAPSGTPPLVIDLALPPDIAPGDAAAAGLPRVGMQDINEEAASTREQRLQESADARVLVDDALEAFRAQVAERSMAPLLAALHKRYRHTAEEGVRRLLRRLDPADPAWPDELEAWAGTLAARLAHIPSKGLRNLATHCGIGVVEAFFRDADKALEGAVKEALASARPEVEA